MMGVPSPVSQCAQQFELGRSSNSSIPAYIHSQTARSTICQTLRPQVHYTAVVMLRLNLASQQHWQGLPWHWNYWNSRPASQCDGRGSSGSSEWLVSMACCRHCTDAAGRRRCRMMQQLAALAGAALALTIILK